MPDNNITVNGIIISSMPIGEYDKRIVLLTKEIGKVSAFVRGARRQSSGFLGVSNAFIYGRFELYRGRSSYTVSKIEATEYFTGITTDINNMMYGSYFLEVSGHFAVENNDEKDRLLLLYRTFQIMSKGTMDRDLIRSIFELKTMVLNGVYPNLFECGSCGAKDNLASLSENLEGVRCGKCVSDEDILLKPATLYTMQYVASSDIKKLFSFELKEDIKKEFVEITEKLRDKYLSFEFKSASFLKI